MLESECICRMFELKQKEVINTRDGSRFGFISDLIIDYKCGKIKSIIVPGPGKVFSFFGKEHEFHIPWECITQIGDDIILVDVETTKVIVNID